MIEGQKTIVVSVITDTTIVFYSEADSLTDLEENVGDTVQVGEQVTVQVQRLLSVMSDQALSTHELMNLLDIKHRPTFRNLYLIPALEKGLVEMTVPDKPNSSKQRYRRRNL